MIAIGSTVGNYEVIAKLGSGAMGSVFLAEHPSIGKRVALKVIHSDLAANAEMVSRFFTEARAVTQIANDHIVDVQNFGQTPEGDNFIIMEFLEGNSLGHKLKEDVILDEETAVHIAWQVADGLAASHARGIIHRDLKPDNIYLVTRNGDPNFVKILDFGLAKLTQNNAVIQHKTQAGSVLGTPHYMAPEQCEGKPDIDHRVDVYALGCIMYEMLCGRVPFPGDGFGEVLVKHLREPPQMPTRLNPHISQGVEKIILHALAKKKEFRFADMPEFRAALRNPLRYAQVLDGERPMGISTLEMLAQSPVRTETPRADKPTLLASLGADEPTPGGGAATQLMDAPTPIAGMPVPIAPPPDESRQTTLPPRTLVPEGRSKAPLVIGLCALLLVGGAGAGWFFLVRPHATKMTMVAITSEPLGAAVMRDGQELGKTPYVLKLPAGGPPAQLVLRKAGFVDARREVAPDGDPAVNVKLTAEGDLVGGPAPVAVDTKPLAPKPLAPTKTPPARPALEARREETKKEPPAPKEPPRKVVKHEAPASPKHEKKPSKKHFDDDVLEPSF